MKLEPGPPRPRCGGQGAGDPWEAGSSDQVTETVDKKTKATQRRGQTNSRALGRVGAQEDLDLQWIYQESAAPVLARWILPSPL